MRPDRRLIELFKIEHPIVLAPMAGLGTVGLAASVCEAGGLGSIGCAMMEPSAAAETIQELRRSTTKPINVNFFCHAQARTDAACELAWRERLAPYRREFEIGDELPRRLAIVERARPEIVSFHFGLPEQPLLDRVKGAGCRVISSATTVAEAR
jgi:nitronate monooxygenase